MAVTREQVAKLYVATFGRAPDQAGLDYWVNNSFGGNATIEQIAQSFFDQSETQSKYPAGTTDAEFITSIYENLFNRAPDAAGLTYWSAELATGNISRGNMIIAVVNGALGSDATVLENKTEVGLYYADDLHLEGADFSVDSVTADPATMVAAMEAATEIYNSSLIETPNTQEYVQVFTLTENNITTVTPAVDGEVITKTVTYWGYDNTGDGVPVADLLNYIAGLADTEDGVNALLAKFEELNIITPDADTGISTTELNQDNFDFSNVTNLSVTSDNGGSAALNITYENDAGELAQAEVELGALYESLIRDLLFTEDGLSRLFEVEVPVTTLWIDEAGTSGYPTATVTINNIAYNDVVVDSDGNPIEITAMTAGTDASSTTTVIPVILTTDVNNGGTEEVGFTSAGNDLIVVGRLDLLHGAYIDGGAGENTLEIDAKGHFAQPKELLNIQNIVIQNLPNVYTVDADNASDYPDVQETNMGDNDSIIDLSRANDLTSLTITEGNFEGLDGQTGSGSLTVSGVRADAVLTLEGQFTQSVTVHYSEGMSVGDDGLNLVLRLGDTAGATFDILANAATVNIDSQGGGNAIDAAFTASSLMDMNISGDAKLQITNSLTPSFQAGTPATIDASANTAGVDLTIDGFDDEVVFTGTQADDHFNANSNGKSVLVNSTSGNDEITANNGQVVEIHVADGNNEVSATNAAVSVTVDATDGNNIVDVSSATSASVTLGDGNNSVTADNSDAASITLGDGANAVSADSVGNLTVTTGTGSDSVSAINTTTANVDVSEGNNTVVASGVNLTLSAGAGNDVFTVAGTDGGTAGTTGSSALNLVLVLDGSGSMGFGAGSNLQAQTDAVLTMLDAVPDSTSVYVVWNYNGGGFWGTKAEAVEIANDLADGTINGTWNTEGFATEAQAAFTTTSGTYNAGGVNQLVFITDGANSAIANEAAWITFLESSDVNSNVIGIGVTDPAYIDGLAYDGISATDQNAILAPSNAELSALLSDLTDEIVTISGNEALVNIDMGDGENTLILGDNDQLSQGLVASNGSIITGENISLVVNQASDLSEASLSGITSVVLTDLDATSTLVLTDTQFLEIGAENFSVAGSVFSQFANLEIIVTETTSLTALGVDDLSSNINLTLSVNDGVTLTMTAQQLHENVAAQGVTLSDDNNTDFANGKVVITDGGSDFDPFNTSDTVKTVINGTQYVGGSLSSDFQTDGAWYNVVLNSGNSYNEDGEEIPAYNRPADARVIEVYTLNTGTGTNTVTDDGITTWLSNLEITGERDINFTGAISLGMLSGVSTSSFTIDFSSLDGEVSNMTVENFELLANGGAIHGNADMGYTSEVLISLANDVANEVGFDEDDALSLVSTGVSRYVVTVIDGPTANGSTGNTATIKLCDTTQDLEVMALRGNYNDTLVVEDAAWGLAFELQGGGTAKAEGPTGTSNVGALVANYEWDGADAVVSLVHSVDGDTRPLYAAGITIVNATSITLNAESDAIIKTLSDGNVTTLENLDLNAQGDLTINTALEAEVVSIDASGVTGDFTVSTAIESINDAAVDFTFVGSAGNTTLTITGDFIASEATSFTSAGNLTINFNAAPDDATLDLTAADVSGVDAIIVAEGEVLNLTIAQANDIGAANISGDGSLILSDLAEEKFVKADYDVNLDFSTLEVVDQASVTLHAETDLTGIDTLLVNDGTTLNLTAAQFQQLTDAGTIAAATNGDEFTVNITNLTQADVDAGFDLTSIGAGATVILNLAESVVFPTNGSVENADIINMTDADMTLTVQTFDELDGVTINGGTNSVVKFLDAIVDNDPAQGIQYPSIDASGFNISEVQFLNLVADDINIDEQLFVNLPQTVEKTIYNGEGMATPLSQTVTIQAQSSIDGDYTAFNKSGDDQNTVEIVDFTINLEGGVNVAGDIELSTAAKDNDFTSNELLKQGLQIVTINSTGTEANLFTDETANVMGTLTPMADNVADATDNTLTTVVINASQVLEMEGIVFNSWSEANNNEADGWTINDDASATATVTVNGTANVALGTLDSTDNEVDAITVNNAGTGTVTATINAANIDSTDALSFTGSNIELTIGGTVDLSNDDLSGVAQLTFADDAVVAMSQAQVEALGAANIVVADTEAATLNINAFDGSVAFDATLFDEQLDVNTITMAAGTNTLTGNFTGVDEIVVPEGGVLNLTAEQYNQIGAIVSFDTDGDSTAEAITVNITDFTQADVAGFSSTKVGAAHTVTLAMAEDIILATATNIENVDTVIMSDTQALSLVTQAQADDLVTSSTGTTTINLEYDVNGGAAIDADGYDVTTLRVWSTAVNGSDVEFVIDNLPNSVTLNIMESPLQIDTIADVNRVVVIEPGVTVPGFLIFNGDDADRELVTLDITFSGDATDRTAQEDFDGNIEGSVINGNLELDFDPDTNGTDVINDRFTKLILNSTGTGDSNGITGNITPLHVSLDVDAEGDNTANNLLDVEINADADFTIGGDIIFNSVDAAQNAATLTVNGAADVSVNQLIVNGSNIDTLNVANDGTGTLTVTGASPAVDSVSLESLVFSGTGDIVLGTVGEGVDGDNVISTIDASTLSGNLTLDNVSAVDAKDFTFTSGTGVTTVNFVDITLNADVDGDTVPTNDDGAGFSVDMSNAAAGSEVHLGGNTYTDGSLTIDLGANTTLYIDENTDWTDLDLVSIAQTNAIVLADGATLTLTATQANGLNIIGGNGAASTGVVNVTNLGTAVYDLSGISADIAGTTTLAANDVTLDFATDLGSFSVTLTDLDTTVANETPMAGQTIRFATEEQAARTVIVSSEDDTGVNVDTNVVWLFDTITDSVNTGDSDIVAQYNYSANLGRLWVTPELLASSNNVEELFTTMPDSIVRVEFSSLEELNFALGSNGIDRSVELVAFTDLSATGLVFNDGDRYEHIESLTISLGGEVQTGDIQLDNIIAASTDPLELDPTGITFNGVTINSYLVDVDTHFLAPELFVNDGDITDEAGEHRLPNAINTVGNISIGVNNGLDLTSVTLNTVETALTVGTITFDSETDTTAALSVSGNYATTVASINTADTNITSVIIDNAGSGSLTITGASPAAAVNATETLTINALGTVTLGTDGDATKPGVSGDDLSLIDVNGTSTVNLGVIANVDSLDFELNTDGHTGVVNATLGDATTAPTLDAGGVWMFDNSLGGTLNLTFTDSVTLGAGDVTLDNVTMTIDGDVDFTTLNELTLNNTTIDVPAGSSLTILASDISGVTVTGDGVVNIMALEDALDADFYNIMTTDGDTGTVNATIDTTDGVDADLLPENLVFIGDLGKAHTTVIGDGSVSVSGADLDLWYDSDLNTVAEFHMATFTVETAATLTLATYQIDDRTVDGAGTVEFVLDAANAGADVNLANMTAANVNASVVANETFNKDADFGTAVIDVADMMTLTVVGETVDGQTITGLGTVLVDDADLNADTIDDAINADFSDFSVANITFVTSALVDSIVFPALYGNPVAIPAEVVQTVTMTAVQANGEVIVGATPGVTGAVIVNALGADATDLSGVNTAIMTANVPADAELDATTDLGAFDVVLANTVDLTLSAAQADGISITEAVDNSSTVTVTALEATPNADLSAIDMAGAGDEVAELDANGNVTLGANLGTNMTVVVSDSVVGANTVTFTGTLNPDGTGLGTTFSLADSVTLVMDADDANLVTVTDALAADTAETTVITFINADDLLDGSLEGGQISVDVGGTTVTVAFNATESQTLIDLAAAINAEMVAQGYTATSVTKVSNPAAGVDDTITIIGNADGSSHPAITNVNVSAATNYLSSTVVQTVVPVENTTAMIVNGIDGDLTNLTDIDALDALTANVTASTELHVDTDLGAFQAVLAEGVTLTLTADQFENDVDGGFEGTVGGSVESLVITQYINEDIDSSALSTNLVIASMTIMDNNSTVNLSAGTNLSKVNEIIIPTGTTLNMTATQFMQLPTGTVSGGGTLNLTGFDNAHAAIDLSSATANMGTITLDTDAVIVLDATANLGDATIVMSANNQSLTLSNETQADGRVVTDGAHTGTVLVLGFTEADATDADAIIDASGYDVAHLWVINEYLYNEFTVSADDANFEEIYDSLDGAIDIVVIDAEVALSADYVDPAAINSIDRTITIDVNTTLDATVAFNDINDPETAVRSLTLNLSGNSVITGDLKLDQNEDPQTALASGNLIQFFETLTINSELDVAGTNEIQGNIYADDSALPDTESEVETFVLTLDGAILVDGTEDQIMFDSEVINLGNGDNTAAVIAKLAAGNYENWYVAATTATTVTFVNKLPGNVTNVTIADFTFNINNVGTVGLDAGNSAVVAGVNGSFNSNENNLLDVVINADQDLIIDGRIEFSYVSGTSDNTFPMSDDDRTAEAYLTVTGAADVTIGALDTQDDHITSLVIDHLGSTGTLTVLGTSPAAAVSDTEELHISTNSAVTLGTLGDVAKPGVTGEELSLIDINTNAIGVVNLGVVSAVDQLDFALTVVGAGTVTARLDSDSLSNNPILADGGVWTFTGTEGAQNLTITVASDVDFNTGTTTFDDVALTLEDNVDLGDGSLVLVDTAVTIGGDVNFSDLTSLTITSSTMNIPAGMTVTMTAALANVAGLTFSGAGTLILVGDAAATDILGIDIAMGSTVTINGSALTSINGTAADVVAALAVLDVDPTNFNSVLTGVAAAADIIAIEAANGTGTINGAALTDINGTAGDVVQALTDLDTDPTNFNSALTGVAAATDITAIEAANGTGLIDGSALTDINGTAAAVIQALVDLDTDPTNFNSALSGVAAAADITAIEAANGTGTIDGSALTDINGTAAAVIQALTDLDTDPANFNTVLAAGAAAAADIIAIEAANGTGTINGSALTDIDGTAADVVQALTDLDTDPANFNTVLAAGAAAAADIIAIEAANGTGTIDGALLTAINGTAAAVVQALADLDTDPVDFNSTLSAGAATAADIAAIEAANGTGTIDGALLTAINGTAAAVVQALADLDTDPVDFNSTLSAGAATAADIAAIEAANGTGTINGAALTDINGTAAAVVQALADLDTDPVDFNSTLSAGAATAADIAAIEAANGTGTINGVALTDINGTTTEILQALTDLDNDPVNFDSTLTAGSDSATNVVTILGVNGTGTIDATAVTTFTGTGANIVTVLTDVDVTHAANVAATVDVGTLSVANQITIDANTTGIVTATITEGDMATLATITDANANNALTITVTDVSVAAAALNTLNGKTTVAVTAAAPVVTLTGVAVDVIASYAANTAGTITGLGNEAVTLAGSTSVADVNSVTGATSGVVTATVTEGDMTTLGGLTSANTDLLAVTVTDTAITASQLLSLDTRTGVTVNVNAATTFIGTATDIISVYAADTATTITSGNDENILLFDSTITGATLNSIDLSTSGAITTMFGTLSITAINGLTMAATSAIDTFVYAATDTGIVINGFTSVVDNIDMQIFGDADNAVATIGAGTTIANNDVFFTTGAAGTADSNANSAVEITADGAAWTETGTVAYFVIADNDSTAIYEYNQVAADGTIATGELTLIGTVNSVLVAGDIIA